MAKTHFDFKQFTIYHDKCAMKVGTDGVLLGAWSQPLPGTRRILDVGTGSGLIAIMLAQKCEAQATGIDLDEEAIAQARENAANSPWANRLHFEVANAISFSPRELYDFVVCNPPFYANALQSPDAKRDTARNSRSLPPDILVHNVAHWLTKDGVFNIILPAATADEFAQTAWEAGLHLARKCWVYSRPSELPKRALLGFRKENIGFPASERLDIREEGGGYTEEYKSLTRDYYLHF